MHQTNHRIEPAAVTNPAGAAKPVSKEKGKSKQKEDSSITFDDDDATAVEIETLKARLFHYLGKAHAEALFRLIGINHETLECIKETQKAARVPNLTDREKETLVTSDEAFKFWESDTKYLNEKSEKNSVSQTHSRLETMRVSYEKAIAKAERGENSAVNVRGGGQLQCQVRANILKMRRRHLQILIHQTRWVSNKVDDNEDGGQTGAHILVVGTIPATFQVPQLTLAEIQKAATEEKRVYQQNIDLSYPLVTETALYEEMRWPDEVHSGPARKETDGSTSSARHTRSGARS